jgi:hypothetical protein
MAFDFPSSPAEGAIYAPPGGPQYQFSGGVWKQVAATGEVLRMVTTIITSSGTYTKPAGLKFAEFECVGGGGGGGGAPATAAGQIGGGGGGGGGSYGYIKWDADQLPASFSYTIGAAGLGAAGVAGGTGGSTILSGPTTCTAAGGVGGTNGVGTTAVVNYGGMSGGAASGFLVNVTGQPGQFTTINSGGASSSISYKGGGGSSMMGWGATHVIGGVSGGGNGTGYGGAGSGDVHGASSAATAGGHGTAGCIILKEYF